MIIFLFGKSSCLQSEAVTEDSSVTARPNVCSSLDYTISFKYLQQKNAGGGILFTTPRISNWIIFDKFLHKFHIALRR